MDPSTTPFRFYGSDAGYARDDDGFNKTTRDIYNQITADGTARILSVSDLPIPSGIVGAYESLPFVVVQSAGNNSTDTFWTYNRNPIRYDAATGLFEERDGEGTWMPIRERDQEGLQNMRNAVSKGTVLYVAGSRVDASGAIYRHWGSSGCGDHPEGDDSGIGRGCIYAPFVAGGVPGTSTSAPRLAAALASVLAVFPDTEGVELIRLTKSCARRESTLDGLGSADFKCMTVLDQNGEWRVVTQGEFDDLISPAQMAAMAFPGVTSLNASFGRAGASGQPIRLGLTRRASFNPSGSGVVEPVSAGKGFSPVLAVGTRSGAIGGRYEMKWGHFIAGSYGLRPEFFGLGDPFGYGAANSFDADIGHENLFARVSHQRTVGSSSWLSSAEGTSLGLTGRKRFLLGARTGLEAAVYADRFIGGTAETAIGAVTMGKSEWTRRARLTFTTSLKSGTLSASGFVYTLYGFLDQGVIARYAARF